jgi:hypothetical protein
MATLDLPQKVGADEQLRLVVTLTTPTTRMEEICGSFLFKRIKSSLNLTHQSMLINGHNLEQCTRAVACGDGNAKNAEMIRGSGCRDKCVAGTEAWRSSAQAAGEQPLSLSQSVFILRIVHRDCKLWLPTKSSTTPQWASWDSFALTVFELTQESSAQSLYPRPTNYHSTLINVSITSHSRGAFSLRGTCARIGRGRKTLRLV